MSVCYNDQSKDECKSEYSLGTENRPFDLRSLSSVWAVKDWLPDMKAFHVGQLVIVLCPSLKEPV